jgi:hypothetical protein
VLPATATMPGLEVSGTISPTEVRPRRGGIILARAAGPVALQLSGHGGSVPAAAYTDRPGEIRGKPVSPEAKCGSDEGELRFPHAILRLLIEAARVQAFSS